MFGWLLHNVLTTVTEVHSFIHRVPLTSQQWLLVSWSVLTRFFRKKHNKTKTKTNNNSVWSIDREHICATNKVPDLFEIWTQPFSLEAWGSALTCYCLCVLFASFCCSFLSLLFLFWFGTVLMLMENLVIRQTRYENACNGWKRK